MKHIKTFNENINQSDLDEIIQNCKDILLDLKDEAEGYDYVVLDDSFDFRVNYKKIFISVQNDNQFGLLDIENILNRLNIYMNSIGWREITCEFGDREDSESLDTSFYYCELEFESKN